MRVGVRRRRGLRAEQQGEVVHGGHLPEVSGNPLLHSLPLRRTAPRESDSRSELCGINFLIPPTAFPPLCDR
jgi:hypothetical protein